MTMQTFVTETKKQEAWDADYHALAASMPEIGLIIRQTEDYVVHVQENLTRPGELSAFVLLVITGNPLTDEHPMRALAANGMKGMKIFLGKSSRQELIRAHAKEIETMLRDSARIRQEAKKLMTNILYQPHKLRMPSVQIYLRQPVKITSYASSGKSAHGEFVLESPGR